MAGRTVVRSDGGPRDGSYRNFGLRGCAVTTTCRWRAICLLPRPVAEPGTLLLGARLSGDPTQRSVARFAPSNCLESLSAAPRLSLSSLVTWSFRTTDEPLPFCRASAPEAFSQWRGRTGRRRIGDSTWKSADRRVSRWIGGLCRSTGVLGSRQFRLREAGLGRGSARAARSGLNTTRGDGSLNPASDFGGVAQLRVSYHSAGAASSGATTRHTQINVLGCPPDHASCVDSTPVTFSHAVNTHPLWHITLHGSSVGTRFVPPT